MSINSKITLYVNGTTRTGLVYIFGSFSLSNETTIGTIPSEYTPKTMFVGTDFNAIYIPIRLNENNRNINAFANGNYNLHATLVFAY